jgi:hypothetical protein
MQWHFHGTTADKSKILYVCSISRLVSTSNDRFYNKQHGSSLSNLFEKESINFLEKVDNLIRNTSHYFHARFRYTQPIDLSASYTDWLVQNDFMADFKSTMGKFTYQELKLFLNHFNVDT